MKKLEAEVRTFLQERGWDNLRPSDISKSIVIEAAELLEIFQWSNMTLEEVKANEKMMEKVKKELADVLIYALDMAVLLDLDTEKIIRDKLAVIKEKYPADLMRKGSQEKDAGTDEAYLQIKQEYRRSGKSE